MYILVLSQSRDLFDSKQVNEPNTCQLCTGFEIAEFAKIADLPTCVLFKEQTQVLYCDIFLYWIWLQFSQQQVQMVCFVTRNVLLPGDPPPASTHLIQIFAVKIDVLFR